MNNFAEQQTAMSFGSEFWTVITRRSAQKIPSPPYEPPRHSFEFSVRRATFIRRQLPGPHTKPDHDHCILAAIEGVPTKFSVMFIPPDLVFETSDDALQWIGDQLEKQLEKIDFMLSDQSIHNEE